VETGIIIRTVGEYQLSQLFPVLPNHSLHFTQLVILYIAVTMFYFIQLSVDRFWLLVSQLVFPFFFLVDYYLDVAESMSLQNVAI